MDSYRFYDLWAEKQLMDEKRERVLKWKAVNFLNLLLRNNRISFEKICEIGGAEGILLNILNNVLNIKVSKNYDISKVFCEIGSKRFPEIDFMNYDFLNKPEYFDLIMLSDITEHVENDKKFLEIISLNCAYLIIKMPIEKAFINSSLFYTLLLKKKPDDLKFGLSHINGHLRGYSIGKAKKTLKKNFHLIDQEISDTAYFNPGKKKGFIKKIFGKRLFIMIYGGAYFALCKSKNDK